MRTEQKIRHLNIKFFGIDRWNRPIYKLIDENIFFGSISKLFDHGATEEEVNNYFADKTHKLEYFGNHFGCEPCGGIAEDIRLHII